MFKTGKKLSILLVSLLTPISVVFSPIVSYPTPPTTFQTLNSPTRLWLMTPEDDERCRQDTERYNAVWTAAWYASHPGQGPAPTPTPSPPYVCPPPPPDNSPAPATQTPVTPNKPIVPGTNQGTGLPNELDNKPGNTPELNTGLGKPGEYKPGYDPATGLPVNGAEQANPNTGDPNDPQTGELARRIAENDAFFNNIPNNGKPIVPANVGPGEPVHQPGQPIVPANVGPDAPKPPAPSKPEIIPNKPIDSGSYTPPAKNTQPPDPGSLNPTKKPVNKIEKVEPEPKKPESPSKKSGEHPDGTNNNDIMKEVKDLCGNTVVLRRGYYNSAGVGFGFDKIKNKHNLADPTMLLTIIENAPPLTEANGANPCGMPQYDKNGKRIPNRRKYEFPIQYTGPLPPGVPSKFYLAIIVDGTLQTDGKPFGVVTAYPEFVDENNNLVPVLDNANRTTEFPSWFNQQTRNWKGN